MSKATFTKKDLAVVLGCIVFLLANLGAIGISGRRRAKEAVCLSNLHQWGVVWKMFTDDNDGYLLEDLSWVEPLRPYYENPKLLLCPEAAKPKQQGGGYVRGGKFDAWWTGYSGIAGSYGLNQWCTRNFANVRTPDRNWAVLPVFAIKRAADAPILLDCALPGRTPLHYDNPPRWDGDYYASGPMNINEIMDFCLNRHNAAVNGAFLDFSARKIGLKELWELQWCRDWYRGDPSPPTEWGNPLHWMHNFKNYATD